MLSQVLIGKDFFYLGLRKFSTQNRQTSPSARKRHRGKQGSRPAQVVGDNSTMSTLRVRKHSCVSLVL